MSHKHSVVALIFLAVLGCHSEAERTLHVTGAHIELGDGVGVNPFGGGEVGKSIYVAGDVTNDSAKDFQFVHLTVDLYRTSADTKPTRVYGDELVDELALVPAGKTVHFRHYVKESVGGYERCEVGISSGEPKE